MAIFQNDPDVWKRLDWAILKNGWTSLYWNIAVLENDLTWLEREQYAIVGFDCSTWTSGKVMHQQLRQKLGFPDYYGENLAALNDCLSELEIRESGLVVVFRHLDSIDTNQIQLLLDSFAHASRWHLLFGNRLMVLAQVDNADFKAAPVGACSIMWNMSEWLDSDRH